MRKGQIAFEFIMMLGMGMILMILFIAVLNIIIREKNDEMQEALFMDLGEAVQNEVLIADVVADGYTRAFTVPPAEMNHSYEQLTYTISNTNDTITITHQEKTYEFPIPITEGNIRIGENLIQKIDGIIHVNT